MFEHIKTVTLRTVFACQESGVLPPYLGSTIRGILGHCIREFVCTESEMRCFLCDKREQCLYVKCFSNTGKEGGAVNPYALYVLNSGKTEWKIGEECIFDIVLFGSATNHAGIYLDAIRKMEEKGWGAARLPFKLMSISNAENSTLIYASGKTWLRNLIPDSSPEKAKKAKTVLIRFDTPVRIVSGKELCRELPFEVLIRFLCRRISLISQIYADSHMIWDEEWLMNLASEIKVRKQEFRLIDFKRYSMTKPKNQLELPAMEGWALYEGHLEPFIPILEKGKYFHVGKGATIGFGHYETIYDR